jgi:hypothetical protein
VGAVLERANIVTFGHKDVRDEVADRFLVVHHENPQAGH